MDWIGLKILILLVKHDHVTHLWGSFWRATYYSGVAELSQPEIKLEVDISLDLDFNQSGTNITSGEKSGPNNHRFGMFYDLGLKIELE